MYLIKKEGCSMKYSKGFEPLGLPENFRFGIELEANNVNTTDNNGLYIGESAQYIKNHHWHMANRWEESLVKDGGAELVSPILHDSPEDWQNLSQICEHITKYPGNKMPVVVTDENCGLHVHFDANCLSQSPNRMKTFLRLYAESEELLYKMCNAEGEPVRKHAITKNFEAKHFHFISALWRNGMAAPSGKKILKKLEDGTLKLSYKKFGKLRLFINNNKLDERRYAGLNLTNIGNPEKNTIEFRMANGTLNPEVIKQTVFLYASLIDTAIKISDNPEEYKEKLSDFFNTDVTEAQKVQSFLSLIMQTPEDRKIYLRRWQSVKDSEVFSKNDKKDFAQGRFKRDEFKKRLQTTPLNLTQNTYTQNDDFISSKSAKQEPDYDR